MKNYYIILFLFIGCCCNKIYSQGKKWPKTLLWKIEGKELREPSYLFGTMHIQDKRIFNLGDSLFYFLAKAEGFALEVDFNEYIDSMLTRFLKNWKRKNWRKMVKKMKNQNRMWLLTAP